MALIDRALTTLANMKLYLGVANDNQNGLITELINKATGFIEMYCDRTFKVTAYSQKYKGSGTDILLLKNYPVIGSVVLSENQSGDSSDDFNAIDTNLYWTFNDEGYVQLTGGVFADIPNKYKAVYEAGYRVQGATVTGEHIQLPHELELACWKLVAAIFNTIGSEGSESQRLGQYSVTFSKVLDKDNELRTVLDNYRHPVV